MSCDVTEPNRWSFSPVLRSNVEHNFVELRAELFSAALFRRRLADRRGLHLLDDSLVGGVASMASLPGSR